MPDTTQIREGMSTNTTCIYSDQQLTLYSFFFSIDDSSVNVCGCLWDICREVQSMYIQVSRSSYLNVAISLLTPSNSFFCSTGKRASDKLLEQVHDFIISLGNEWGARTKRRGEILYIYGPDDPLDIRKISSYPSGSDKLRGVGGDVIYLEEAAFM